MSESASFPPNAIAIIGMAGRFPGAATADELWQLVRNGREAIRDLSDAELRAAGVPAALLNEPNYVRRAATLDGYDTFDAQFFGFSPRDAAIMDPQHRAFLETAWEALERAGYTPEGFAGSIGVFGGCGMQAYFAHNLLNNAELMRSAGYFLIRHTGNDKDFLSTRVSYQLNLRGPSVSVQTACSTSLVAVHLACQSLLNRESDMALAGGATIELPHGHGYLYEEGEILSPDGRCRAFDAASKGTVFGSGVGIVVLRRLEDAIEARDHVHAIILGSAVNNDGAGKVGYLAPSVDGQAAVVAEAIAVAGVEPESITYVETHGTGTPVGDPIEVAALTEAFGTARRQFCAIGSIKTNIGHLDTAAGVASLIKAASAVERAEIPPSLHFEQPNPTIDFASTPFFVNARLAPWQPDGPRRAGITSLGVGGTNAHVILEEPPTLASGPGRRPAHLLLLSARTPAALDAATNRLADHLAGSPDLSLDDVAWTLQVGRRAFTHRRALVCADVEDAVATLRETGSKRLVDGVAPDGPASLVFLFPGGGAQYPDMGRGLYEHEPLFREIVDRGLDELRQKHGIDLRPLLFPSVETREAAARALERSTHSILSVFIVEYALARLWMSWGLEPDAMTGHSLGEYTAACLAGVFSFEDALTIVKARGDIFERLPAGAMLSVPLPEAEARALVSGGLGIAAINGPALSLISGPLAEIDALEGTLAARDIETRRLHISVAAHSAMLEPHLDGFAAALRAIRFNTPTRPFISNLTGDWARPDEVTDPSYWVRHLRQTVRFSDGTARLLETPHRVFVEVGPGHALGSLVRLHVTRESRAVVVSSMRHPREDASDVTVLLEAVGRAWMHGCHVDWAALHGVPRRRVPLPTYPFERQRYWIEPSTAPALAHTVLAEAGTPSTARDVTRWLTIPFWSKAEHLPTASVSGSRWLLCTSKPNDLDGLARSLAQCGATVQTVSTGDGFSSDGANFVVNPTSAEDLRQLLAAVGGSANDALNIVVAWTRGDAADGDRPFVAILALAQAIADSDIAGPVRIAVLSRALRPVGHTVVQDPAQALAAGTARVIAAELPAVSAASIDVDPNGWAELAGAKESSNDTSVQIVREVLTGLPSPQVALHGSTRWLPAARQLPPAATSPVAIRPGGTYLLTGGLGGIALTLAEALAARASVNLVLVSRRDISAVDAGDRARILDAVERIEAGGSTVSIERADVTSHDETAAMIDRVRKTRGTIHGIVHAAGVLDDSLLTLKTADSAQKVLGPKVTGTMVLHEALGDEPLDFWINCSSVSATLGLPGQIDYAAANAFLDAFAEWRSAQGRPTTSIAWQAWRDVGMLAAPPPSARTVDESWTPLAQGLLQRVRVDNGQATFAATLSPSADWVLDEHRLTGGEALMPGTGFLEIAIEAARHGLPDAAVDLQELTLLSPFSPGNAPATIEVVIDRTGGDIAVRSTTGGDPVDHVKGAVAPPRPPSGPLDIPGLEARCSRPVENPAANLAHLNVGPRWRGTLDVRLGHGEAFIRASLPDSFAAEAGPLVAHPALVDLVTAGSFHIVEGYVPASEFFVPISYGRVASFGRLPASVVCHARRHDAQGTSSADVVELDLTIADAGGQVLLEIERFAVRRLAPFASLGTAQGSARKSMIDMARAITPEEGAAAFLHVLANLPLSRVIVGPASLPELEHAAAAIRVAGPSGQGAAQRRHAPLVAPRDEIEKQVAEIWRELLGVADIGVDDDFFELGGHSLLLAQLGSRLRRAVGAQIPIAVLFDRPTVARLADYCRTAATQDIVEEPALVAIPRERMRRSRSSLDPAG